MAFRKVTGRSVAVGFVTWVLGGGPLPTPCSSLQVTLGDALNKFSYALLHPWCNGCPSLLTR